MQTAAKKQMTVAEYLEWERLSPTKHAFLAGEVFAMAGGSEMHSALAANAIGALRARLRGQPCRVYTSDMRLRVEATDYFSYPDVQVACDPRRFDGDKRDVLLNPSIIIEVLSDSTAAWDRGEKFWHFRHIESFREYVLVSQDAWQIEHYTRQPNGAWLLESVEGQTGVLRLPTIQCDVPLAEVYGDTGLAPDARPAIPPAQQKAS
jgi:Uma2 family endonuclease